MFTDLKIDKTKYLQSSDSPVDRRIFLSNFPLRHRITASNVSICPQSRSPADQGRWTKGCGSRRRAPSPRSGRQREIHKAVARFTGSTCSG
jgi:hypothetical protein